MWAAADETAEAVGVGEGVAGDGTSGGGAQPPPPPPPPQPLASSSKSDSPTMRPSFMLIVPPRPTQILFGGSVPAHYARPASRQAFLTDDRIGNQRRDRLGDLVGAGHDPRLELREHLI